MRALLIFQSVLVFAAFLSGCSFRPGGRRAVAEGDFIEPVSPGDEGQVWRDIAALRDRIEREPRSADLYRRLCVLYRLAGTPRSRLLSSEEIERAIELDPNNPLLYVEQGLTFIARTFVGEAEASFTHATQLDPACFEAWFQLGRMEQYEYFKTMCFSEHLAKAIEYFEKASRLERKDEETLVNLAFLYSFRRMYETGLRYGTRATMYHPRSVRAHLVCGMLCTRLKDFEKAEKEYSAAFLLMPEQDRVPYDDISPLLSPGDRELYMSSSGAKRQDWNRRFWAENDPTPATELNERRLEHFTRVVIADWALSDERRDARGTETDRGAALLRFGLPDRKLYDLGGGMSGGWIVWQYTLPAGSFNLYFNDEFLNGDYHFPITDYYGEESRMVLNTVPQRYEYPIQFAPFPISVEIAQRRGADERTRLEFSIAIPDSVRRSKSPSWNLFVTFFDSQWNRFSRDLISLRPDSLPLIEKGNGRFLVSNFSLEMLPRELTCTCFLELILDTDRRKGTRRCPLEIRDMYGRSLKLSSIKLTIPDRGGACSSILDPLPLYPERGRLCLTYEIYNLKLDDNNESRYRLTYSIRSPEPEPDGQAAGLRRTLSYIWSSVTGKKSEGKPYIESSMEHRSRRSMVSDALQIDIGALERGTYVLSIAVEDLVTGAAAEENQMFTVSE
jgi:GWxTD domain-containing protein